MLSNLSNIMSETMTKIHDAEDENVDGEKGGFKMAKSYDNSKDPHFINNIPVLLLMIVICEFPVDFTESDVTEGEAEEHVAVPDLGRRPPVRARAPGDDPQHHLHL